MRSARLPLLALTLTLAAAAAGCDANASGRAPSRGEQAKARVEAGAKLVDVRTPGEYASGHLPGAVNIPLNQLAGRLAEVQGDAEVVVYCAAGRRSAQAASLLTTKGVKVFDLGAIHNWPR